ncbi:Obg-like ATPase 1 [Mycena indigotica]|uniref:Obg-like ATPase homolog n=1 Tax=Mycena indigotica TaxID=2126181 RepID=A0A8H6WER8_9AGAR|nr:Obg-like ATPase 1 [Mycena indigotica]KAF7312138.1 Obg-like ATPase 1 [Mycena indigotica]
MPPKKSAGPEKKTLLGRPGNNLKIGIVGVPNVGKSSFFNVLSRDRSGKGSKLSLRHHKVSYSPVSRTNSNTTDSPEEARIPVPDPRFDWLCDLYKPASRVPAFLTCIDIAGLTAGASTGAGLGNAFLSHVRAVDGIFQMVRAFDDAEVIHVDGDVDPIRDITTIQTELRLKDIEWTEKAIDTLKKGSRALGNTSLADKAKKEELATVEKVLQHLNDGKIVRKGDWSNKEIDVINGLMLLTARPITYLVNLSEKDYARKKNKWLPKIKAWIDENNPGDLLIPFSVAFEEKLAPLNAEEKEEVQKAVGATSALGKITQAGYASLDLIRYFTCGPDEVRAWTIRKGTKAPQAAGVIHSDFENKFVCGEIMSYDDLKEQGSETAVKAAGKVRQQGKPYEMVDGDIAYWKSGA